MSQSTALPPIPKKGIHLLIAQKYEGPFTLSYVNLLFSTRKIDRTTLLWFAPLENWITVGDLPQFERRPPVNIPPPPLSSVTYSENHAYFQGDEPVRAILRGVESLIPASELPNFVKSNELRRADLLFDAHVNKWVRADQHPIYKNLFMAVPLPQGAEY